jgi:hypothetical protein
VSGLDWDAEMTRYLTLSHDLRLRWLAELLSALTIFARMTYTVGGEGLDEPERLRRFNELFHRVAGQLRDAATGNPGRPDDVFIKTLTAAIDELSINHSNLLAYLRRE